MKMMLLHSAYYSNGFYGAFQQKHGAKVIQKWETDAHIEYFFRSLRNFGVELPYVTTYDLFLLKEYHSLAPKITILPA